jgi:polyphosphate kinase
MELTATSLLRLTRDVEIEIHDDPDAALSELVKEQIRHRRYEPVVRLEFAPGTDPTLREMLRTGFDLLSVDIYDMPDEVDFTTLFEIAGLQLSALWHEEDRIGQRHRIPEGGDFTGRLIARTCPPANFSKEGRLTNKVFIG